MTVKKTMAQESSEDFVKRMCEPQRNISILKAQNEMLEEARLECIERGDVDEGIISQIEGAKEDNLRLAMSQYGATPEDVDNAQYHGASIKAIKAYENRLKKKGLTDEMLHQKNLKLSAVNGSKELNDEDNKFKNNKRTEAGVGKVSDDAATNVETSDTTDAPKSEEKKTKRRARKGLKNEKPNTTESSTDEKIGGEIEITVTPDKTIDVEKSEPVRVEVRNKKKKNESEDYSIDDFHMDDIPDYVQYDIIPLPSKGQCYKHKKSRIPVAYLTASDENLIASPNMYRDGKLLDVILQRKILDKDFKVDELCSGDRDAIVLWLRATSYGEEFPIIATNPNNGKQYNISVNLSEFKYYDFDLKSNDNAEFEFVTSNGDKIGFKFLSRSEESEFRDKVINEDSDVNRANALKSVIDMRESIERLDISDEDKEHVSEDIDELISIIGSDIENSEKKVYSTVVTDQMLVHTTSVNGNTDRNYIKGYIENMRTKDAKEYRDYLTNNRPGVDFTIDITAPESDGGDSFTTFLRLDDTVFINF